MKPRTTRERIEGAGYGFHGVRGHLTFLVTLDGKTLCMDSLSHCSEWADRKGIAP